MQFENQHLLIDAFSTGLNLFVGAGFSTLAKDTSGKPLPLGAQLRDELASHMGQMDLRSLDLPQLASVLYSTNRDSFYKYLADRFTVSHFDSKYRVLDSLNIASIFTTNIDTLLESIYANSGNHFLNDLDLVGPSWNKAGSVELVHLHGSVRRLDGRLLFSPTELAAAFTTDPDKFYALSSRLAERPTLFWGYGLNDAGVLETLQPRTGSRRHEYKWIVVHPPAATDPYKAFLKSMGFQIIVASTSEMLEWISTHAIAGTKSPVPGNVVQDSVVKQYAVPNAGTTPVRAVREFFLGSSPSWYDAYSNHIPKLHHYAIIDNAIKKGGHTFVVGLPACGKTTILRQLAVQMTYSGLILTAEIMTEGEARLLATRLSQTKCLLLFDNAFDSAEAINQLAGHANIQLCCFDRNYNYEIASQRISFKHSTVDVSSLDAIDEQAVMHAIPKELAKEFMSIPLGRRHDEPTVFEVIDANVKQGQIQERYRGVLDELRRHGVDYLDFLLVCCYVHRCRTPISMDMLIAFFRDRLSYDSIYEVRNNLGNLLRDNKELVDDVGQDLYAARSAIICDAVLRQCRPTDLARILTTFQKEVSPYRIFRYDVFRRNAYDNELALMAFPNWQDGYNFYERGFGIDRSYYMKQHGALYLSKKKQFQKAFDWIHDALYESGNRIFSIRNSYAAIMFNANIEADEHADGIVRKTLLESMQILKSCIDNDRRSAYHVFTFADQAIKLHERYGDAESAELIELAVEWVEREIKAEPWNTRLRFAAKRLKNVRL